MNPLIGLVALPAELVVALRQLSTMNDRLDEMSEFTAVLPDVLDSISKVADDTAALKALRRDMGRMATTTQSLGEMAEATDVLPGMDERMATIERSMPVLVEVQQHLARLPETMDTLGNGLTELSGLMAKLLQSLDRLDRNVDSLRSSVEPLGRIAERLPGGGSSRR